MSQEENKENKDLPSLDTLTDAEIRKLPKEQRQYLIKQMSAKRMSDYMSSIFLDNLNNPENHDKSK